MQTINLRPLYDAFFFHSSNEDNKLVNPNCPIFDVPTSQYTVEKIINMLLDPDKSFICRERPIDIRGSATYVIDLNQLQDPDDVKRDVFGKWNNSGSHTIPFKSWYTEQGDVELERLKPGYSGLDVQILRRIHYTHPSDARCKRMLAFITGQCQVL